MTLTVITSIHNKGDRTKQSIESVLSQTFDNFQYWVVDDGSTDQTKSILAEFSDPRLTIITQENIGFVKTIIEQMGRVRTSYVALQGAGDISHRDRFKLQYEYLNTNPDVSVVSAGTIYSYGDTSSTFSTNSTAELLIFRHPAEMLGSNPINHGEVMMRTDAYHRAGGYRAFFRYAQDNDLWLRILFSSGTIVKLPNFLYKKIVSPESDICGNLKRTEEQTLYSIFAKRCVKQRLQGRVDPLDKYGPQAFIDFIFSLTCEEKQEVAWSILVQNNSKTSLYQETLCLVKYYTPNHPELRDLEKRDFYKKYFSRSALKKWFHMTLIPAFKRQPFLSKLLRRLRIYLSL